MTTATQIPLVDLRLSARAYNALRRARYDHLDQIEGKSVDDLLFIQNIGQQSAEEIVSAIAAYRRANR
jgi:DNA-directed RNA polymerase alpha subunit